MSHTNMTPKEFRREVGREMRRMYKLQKEQWSNGRRLYIRILRITHNMFGMGYKEMWIMNENPAVWKEAKIYIKGIVDWCEFLLTIQPRERQKRKNVEAILMEDPR